MNDHPQTASARMTTRLSPPSRLIGLDAARGAALLAMMITHIFALSDDMGMPTWAAVFSGRASALFAVLAGCSLVLASRGTLEATGRLRDVAPGVLVRAASIIVIGLFLGTISTNLAVILVNYGVMFALALLVLRLRASALFALAGLWMLLSPVVSQWLRGAFGLEAAYLPMGWFDFMTPQTMATDLFVTGYYPILQWMSYILLGMAVAKLDIEKHLTAVFAAGVGLLVVGRGVSWLLLDVGGGMEQLVAASEASGTDLLAALYTGSYGVAPADSWWWLAIAGPHSGTPFDLLSTAGIALIVIAVYQAAAMLLGRRSWLLAPLSAPGSMPLTIYTLHVIGVEITHPIFQFGSMTGQPATGPETIEYLIHALGLIAFAIVWKLVVSPRGPLEAGIATLVRAVSPQRPDREIPAEAVGRNPSSAGSA